MNGIQATTVIKKSRKEMISRPYMSLAATVLSHLLSPSQSLIRAIQYPLGDLILERFPGDERGGLV